MAEKKKHAKKSAWAVLLRVAALLCMAGLLVLFGLNYYVKQVGKAHFLTEEAAAPGYDCALVLGAGIVGDAPSDMLRDRLDTAISLYNKGIVPKLLMSGDHGGTGHNEVGVMKTYAMKQGVPSSDIFMDHAGFSTYDSLSRAKQIFGCTKIVAVTQSYHLYRALFLGEKLGITVDGVPSDLHTYKGQTYRDVREILARNKECVMAVLRPAPMVSGDKISLAGSGDITNDDAFAVLAGKMQLSLEQDTSNR